MFGLFSVLLDPDVCALAGGGVDGTVLALLTGLALALLAPWTGLAGPLLPGSLLIPAIKCRMKNLLLHQEITWLLVWGACRNPLVIFSARFASLTTAECLRSSMRYVGYTLRHLFQCINEHKHSAIGKYLHDIHNQMDKDLHDQFTILKKCRGKLDC